MPVRIRGIVAGAFLVAALLLRPAVPFADESRLQRLLARLDRIASLYRDNALKFSCIEKVTYSSLSVPARTHKLEYIYEYKDGNLTDYRTPYRRRHPGGEVPRRVELSDYEIPYYLNRAYSWVFTFERNRWSLYHYRIVGEERVLGHDAVQIRFDPRPPVLQEVNDWYGRVWVDKETSQLLRVEALKADQHAEERRLRAALARDSIDKEERYEIATVVTEFSIEENGMRFPGRVEIVRNALPGAAGQRARLLRPATGRASHSGLFKIPVLRCQDPGLDKRHGRGLRLRGRRSLRGSTDRPNRAGNTQGVQIVRRENRGAPRRPGPVMMAAIVISDHPEGGGRLSHPAGHDLRKAIPWKTAIVLAAIAALGFLLRARCFHAYADTWDPCEYVWAVEGGFLPHSPYILYLWLGRLLALAMPADVALSVISLVAGTGMLPLLALVVRRQTGSALAGCLAAAALAVFPCAVWFSGIQEVYALAGALLLGAILAAGRRGVAGAAVSGALFGCALAAHTGMVFAAPAWIVAVAGADSGAQPRGGWRRLSYAVAAAMLVPVAAVVWVIWVLPHSGPGGEGLVAYLAGIAPMPVIADPGHLAGSLVRTLGGALEETLRSALPALVLAACLGAAWLRFPRTSAFWVVHAAPYLAYEVAIGWNVDPGVHLVFAGPAIAAMLGCGAVAASQWLVERRRRAAVACTSIIAVALLPAVVASYDLGALVLTREAFLSSGPVRALMSLRDTTPTDAVVVQPPDVYNVNLVPAYAHRRPIIHQEGRYMLFEGRRGSPLNLTSFSMLTGPLLDRLLQERVPVISIVAEPFPAGGLGLRWVREGDVYRLAHAR